jgi:hypothetical protein
MPSDVLFIRLRVLEDMLDVAGNQMILDGRAVFVKNERRTHSSRHVFGCC